MAELGFQLKLLVSEYKLLNYTDFPKSVIFFSLKLGEGNNAISCFHFNVFIHLLGFALCQPLRIHNHVISSEGDRQEIKKKISKKTKKRYMLSGK